MMLSNLEVISPLSWNNSFQPSVQVRNRIDLRYGGGRQQGDIRRTQAVGQGILSWNWCHVHRYHHIQSNDQRDHCLHLRSHLLRQSYRKRPMRPYRFDSIHPTSCEFLQKEHLRCFVGYLTDQVFRFKVPFRHLCFYRCNSRHRRGCRQRLNRKFHRE